MEIIETTKDTEKRFAKVTEGERGVKAGAVVSNYVTVDTSKTYQTFKGFGGAITESVGYVLSFLSQEQQKKIMKSYFDSAEGNGYVFTRTHLNSCDFSLENWTCVKDNDETLESFSMDRTNKYITPYILDAIKLSDGKLNVI